MRLDAVILLMLILETCVTSEYTVYQFLFAHVLFKNIYRILFAHLFICIFFLYFLHFTLDENLDTYDIELVNEEDRAVVEADSYWCMSKLLDGIQDNYTFAQPGIQTKVQQLRELMKRIDSKFLKAFLMC